MTSPDRPDAAAAPLAAPSAADPGDAALRRDRALLERWRNGDTGAGVELLDLYAAFARRLAARMGVRGRVAFAEFWQDLVLRVLSHLPDLHERLRTSFAGYLAWQVRDLVRSWRRRARRAFGPEIEAVGPDRHGNEARVALQEALDDCTGRLSPRERAVFEHRFVAGLDLGEVAERVGSNANAVAQAVFRLVRRLRECLATKGFAGPGDFA